MSKITLVFVLLFTTLFAQQEEFPFMGITLSTKRLDFKSLDDTSSKDENTIGLRYGQQSLEWRTMFTLSANDDFQSIDLEIDKILFDDLFGMPELRPYLGATVGYLHYDTSITSLDNNALYYGGNFGFIIYVTDHIDADLSYHYYDVSDMKPLDTIQGVSFSLHYFY